MVSQSFAACVVKPLVEICNIYFLLVSLHGVSSFCHQLSWLLCFQKLVPVSLQVIAQVYARVQLAEVVMYRAIRFLNGGGTPIGYSVIGVSMPICLTLINSSIICDLQRWHHKTGIPRRLALDNVSSHTHWMQFLQRILCVCSPMAFVKMHSSLRGTRPVVAIVSWDVSATKVVLPWCWILAVHLGIRRLETKSWSFRLCWDIG